MPNHHCPSGKVKYHSPKQAYEAARYIKRRPSGEGFPATAYHCTTCGGWHITGHTRNQRALKAHKLETTYDRHDKSWAREVEV